MEKRGQTQQIFTWIFILILAVTVLFFGIKTVRQGEDFKDEVLLIDFYKNLEKKINDFYFLDIGSSGREDFILPNGVREVCFINQTISRKIDGSEINPISGIHTPYIDQLDEFSNVFVFPNTEFKENRVKLDKFIVGSVMNENPLCISVSSGVLNIKLENVGRYVEIKNG